MNFHIKDSPELYTKKNESYTVPSHMAQNSDVKTYTSVSTKQVQCTGTGTIFLKTVTLDLVNINVI